METLLSLAIGIGLSAACGFRVFVPLLAMSIAAHTGHLNLAGSFAWIGSTPAMIALSAATALEIGAYYIPFLDNLLDTVATPSAIVAGIIATAAQVTDLDPLLGWSAAIIAGGGAAALTQGLTTVTRQVSALTTAGLGNPIVATLEIGAAVVLTLFAILLPFAAVIALLALLYVAAKKLFLRPATAKPTA